MFLHNEEKKNEIEYRTYTYTHKCLRTNNVGSYKGMSHPTTDTYKGHPECAAYNHSDIQFSLNVGEEAW